MIIAVDLDEVLGEYLDAFLSFYNRKHGTMRVRREFTTYSFWETLGETKEEFVYLLDEFCASEHFEDLSPIEDALGAIRELSRDHDLILITARPQKLEAKTREWLERHFPGMFKRVHLTNQFERLGYWRSKAQVCLEEGAQLIIEDSLEYAAECARQGVRALLMDRPWNQAPSLPANVHRVHGWGEVLEILTTADA